MLHDKKTKETLLNLMCLSSQREEREPATARAEAGLKPGTLEPSPIGGHSLSSRNRPSQAEHSLIVIGQLSELCANR